MLPCRRWFGLAEFVDLPPLRRAEHPRDLVDVLGAKSTATERQLPHEHRRKEKPELDLRLRPRMFVSGQGSEGGPVAVRSVRIDEGEGGCPRQVCSPQVGERRMERDVAVARINSEVAMGMERTEIRSQLRRVLGQFEEHQPGERWVGGLERQSRRSDDLLARGAGEVLGFSGEQIEIDDVLGLLARRREAIQIVGQHSQLDSTPESPPSARHVVVSIRRPFAAGATHERAGERESPPCRGPCLACRGRRRAGCRVVSGRTGPWLARTDDGDRSPSRVA